MTENSQAVLFRNIAQLGLNLFTIFTYITSIFQSGIYMPDSYKVNVIGDEKDDPLVTSYLETHLTASHSYLWARKNCTDSNCDLYSILATYIGSTRSDMIAFIESQDKEIEMVLNQKNPWFFYDTVNDMVSGMIQYLIGDEDGIFLNTYSCIDDKKYIDFKFRIKALRCLNVTLSKLPKQQNSSKFLGHHSPSRSRHMKYLFEDESVPEIQMTLYTAFLRRRLMHNDIFFKSYLKRRSTVWARKNVIESNLMKVIQTISEEGLSTIAGELQISPYMMMNIPKFNFLPSIPTGSKSNYMYTFLARVNADPSSKFGTITSVDGIIIGGEFQQITQFEIMAQSQNLDNIKKELNLRWLAQIYIYVSIIVYVYWIGKKRINEVHGMRRSTRLLDWMSNCEFGSLLANDFCLSILNCYSIYAFGFSSAVRWSMKVNIVSPKQDKDYMPLTFEEAVNSLSENGRGTFCVILLFQLLFVCMRNTLPMFIDTKLIKKAIERMSMITTFRKKTQLIKANGPCIEADTVGKRFIRSNMVLRVQFRIYGLIMAIYTLFVTVGIDKIADRSKDVETCDQEWLFSLDLMWGIKFQPAAITMLCVLTCIAIFPQHFMVYEELEKPVLLVEKYRVFSITSLIVESKGGLNTLCVPALIEVYLRHYWLSQKDYLKNYINDRHQTVAVTTQPSCKKSQVICMKSL